jgi:hypothetical protein
VPLAPHLKFFDPFKKMKICPWYEVCKEDCSFEAHLLQVQKYAPAAP